LGFLPWLAGRFYDFELTKNREKQEMALPPTGIYFLKLSNVSVFLTTSLLK
jgi:hypothetical protein